MKLPDLQRSADLLSADGPCVVPPRSWDPEPTGICRVWKIASHKLSSILQRQGHCASPDLCPVWLQLFCTFIRPLHGNEWARFSGTGRHEMHKKMIKNRRQIQSANCAHSFKMFQDLWMPSVVWTCPAIQSFLNLPSYPVICGGTICLA